MQTKFINPSGAKPACSGANKGYFTDESLLDKVPEVFLLLAGVYFAMQLAGCALIRNPSGYSGKKRWTAVIGVASRDGQADRRAIGGVAESAPLLSGGGGSDTVALLNDGATPREAAGTATFWLIWVMFGLNGRSPHFA